MKDDKPRPESYGESIGFLESCTQLSAHDALRLVAELLEDCPGMQGESLIKHCRAVIRLGVQAYYTQRQTVPFTEAIKAHAVRKEGQRVRTLREMYQICNRIISMQPEWGELSVRQVTPEICQRTLEAVFSTVPMQRKGRRILHSIFEFSRINGWCDFNPLDRVVLPPYEEKTILALNIKQVLKLLEVAKRREHAACAAALGIMLWAGVRPNEVSRLKQKDVNFEDRVITVPANHSKTGGARQVTMYPVLYHWLRKCMHYVVPEAPIVPRSWIKRWRLLRQDAGFENWVPDILRHTFASYHLKYFKNLNALQVDMGHSKLDLLRTRYLAMEGVTAKGAAIFWEYGLPTEPNSPSK